MNARFFYAAPIFTNAPKLMVLSENSVLYSEYRDYEVLKVDKKEGVNFDSFEISNFETEDYPILLEIGFKEAADMPLNGQANWINRYIKNNNISVEMAMQA